MKEKKHRAFFTSIFYVALLWQLPVVHPAEAGQFGQLVLEKDSLYHRIFVYQTGPVATLRFGKGTAVAIQSQVDMSDLRRHMLEYTSLSFCGLLYKAQPQRVLVLGLGGGVIPREMRYYFPATDIDVAEIDNEIPLVAKQFFGFREDDKLKVHVDDGRMFIKKQLRRNPIPKYDLVILDAFNGDYIPFHLMTKEFLEEVKGVLAEDGAVIANVFYTNRLFDAEMKTFLAVFGRCQVFFAARYTNAMLVSPGADGPMLTLKEAQDRAKALQSQHGFAFDILTVAKRLRPDTSPDSRAKVLTDDRAPVNWLRMQEKAKSPDDVP
jgi:spermidine synthase